MHLSHHSHGNEHEPVVSHGRGGQGNIAPDPTPYVDASIVREGPYGDQGDGAYSAGRGGAGNIGAAHVPPNTKAPHDTTVIPEPAIVRRSEGGEGGDFFIGRGGQGNAHLDPEHAKEREEKRVGWKKMGWGLWARVRGLFGRK